MECGSAITETPERTTDSGTDAELVARVLAGEMAAYGVLARRHFRACFAVAFARLRDADDAEDVCQDALLRAYERLGECRDPSRYAHWLLRIVRNRSIRRLAYQRVRRAAGLERASEATASATPEADLTRSELRRALQAAFDRLRPKQREVVLLFDHEGYSHREIAERLNISETMSRRHLSDARAALRRELRRHR
jgi:RNA polymerase sigma-70 factor, ECF subfamily